MPLTCSGLVKTPTQLGALDPLVVLPDRLLRDADAETLDMVFVHELAHVRGHDCVFRLLSMVARAIYWPVPLAWLACRMLAEAQEQACDDCVVDATRDPDVYAGSLLDLAAGAQPGPALALGLEMARRPRVFGRVERVAKIGRKAASPIGGASSLLTTVALAGCAAGLGAVTAMPSRPEVLEVPVPVAIQQTIVAAPSLPSGRNDAVIPQRSTVDQGSGVVTGSDTKRQVARAFVPEAAEIPSRTDVAEPPAVPGTGARSGIVAALLSLEVDQGIQVRGSRGVRSYPSRVPVARFGGGESSRRSGQTRDQQVGLGGNLRIGGQVSNGPSARRADDWWLREQTHGRQ